jgi:hypothetical protein
MAATPGFARQAQYRTTFRVLGTIVLVVGLVVFVYGVVSVLGSEYEPEGRSIVAFIAGLPIIGVGLMLLQWGFLGAAARYGAGEAMPVVKDSLDYLKTGPFCSKCGVRNDEDAKFCDSCGAALT